MSFLFSDKPGPIGIFDSGYGGLTILKAIRRQLPYPDYIYLGDNARAPYGNRSFETVYQYTAQCVEWLFKQGCHLVIVACNTASAKALRTIQQKDLPRWDSHRRVLGVLRPTTEIAGSFTKTGHIGILATSGTVKSGSYEIEIKKFFPELHVWQQACPVWVPLIETGEYQEPEAVYFFKKYTDALLSQQEKIDAVLLGCTHYPLVTPILRKLIPSHIQIIEQGPLVANALDNYLQRHPEIREKILCNGQIRFVSTETRENFLNELFQRFFETDELDSVDFRQVNF
jgi:glutamate racemase